MSYTPSSPWYYSKYQLFIMYLRFFAHIVLMASALCFAALLGGYNVTKYLLQYKITNIIIILSVTASIIYFLFDRNFYLPFLGWAVYPCGSLAQKIPLNADTNVVIQVPPNVNVIYWASEPSKKNDQPIGDPWEAYANYDNSGVVKSDATGKAILSFRSPSSYNVGALNKTLKIHVHYRICKHPGMLSDVKTVFL
jgi:hypothetical protein